MTHWHLRTSRFLPAAVGVLLVLTSCSDSGNAGEAISSQEPAATATPLTLGAPTSTASDATNSTTTIVTDTTGTTTAATPDPSATTTSADGAAAATPTVVAAPTVSVELADTAFTNSSKVTTVGLDEVFFGMDPNEAADAASTTWVGMPETASWPSCFVVTPSNGPEGVSFWVFNRTVERVNISHPSIRTRSGYGVGTQLAELTAALGDQLEVTDFGDGTKSAVFVPSDPTDAGFRLIFELRNDEVTRFRTGRLGVVELPDTSCA